MKKILTVASLLAGGVVLGSCAGHMPASVGGECRVFSDPGFAVRGKRLKDDQWIGATQEKGIQVCGWTRPKLHPAVTRQPDKLVRPTVVPVVEQQPTLTPAPVIQKKKHWYDRFRRQQPKN